MPNGLSLYRGEKKIWTFIAADDGVAINLTGAALYFEMRLDRTDTGAALISKTIGSGITVLSAVDGYFELEFSKADTNSLAPSSYAYGIEYILAGETEPRVLVVDHILIKEDVVRVV